MAKDQGDLDEHLRRAEDKRCARFEAKQESVDYWKAQLDQARAEYEAEFGTIVEVCHVEET